jgi:hypothetical protein
MLTSFIHIPVTPTVQEYKEVSKETNEIFLIEKFYLFLEDEIEKIHIKNAFKQIEDLKK